MSQKVLSILVHAGFSSDVMEVVGNYNKRNRHYHDMLHIHEMLDYVEKAIAESHLIDCDPIFIDSCIFSGDDTLAIKLAVIFHDVIYDVKSRTNEEDSAQAFVECVRKYVRQGSLMLERLLSITPLVVDLIIATKHHDIDAAHGNAERLIIRADLDRFTRPFPEMWNGYLKLFREYAIYDLTEFKSGRAEFLEQYKEKIKYILPKVAIDNIDKQITALEVWQPKIAVYPGSFNPMHIGHLNIIEKAEKIFDKVIIVVGENSDKSQRQYEIPKAILDSHQVDYYSGLLSDYVASKDYPVTVIRGLRNTTDMQYELNQYRWLQELNANFNMVSIFCDKEFEHISSSAIRSLTKYKGQIEDNVFFGKYLINS